MSINNRVTRMVVAVLGLLLALRPADAPAGTQVDKGEVVAESGLNVKEGERLSWDESGRLEGQHAGYFRGRDGKTYTLGFRGPNGQNAVLQCRGRIAWDSEGRLVEGKDGFVSIMTAANDGHWYLIASTEFQDGILSLTAEEGIFTEFPAKTIKQKTSRTKASLVRTKKGYLRGRASFILGNFLPDFGAAGSIWQDPRNITVRKE